jgi:hypothetical protein
MAAPSIAENSWSNLELCLTDLRHLEVPVIGHIYRDLSKQLVAEVNADESNQGPQGQLY